MIVLNDKMRRIVCVDNKLEEEYLNNLKFSKLLDGYFFDNAINDNVVCVADIYSKDSNSDWSGYEYSTNKIHLEDEISASIYEIASLVFIHILPLVDRFKFLYPKEKPVFWFSCDELGEFPSATLGFYVKREKMLPLLPEDEVGLSIFPQPLMVAS